MTTVQQVCRRGGSGVGAFGGGSVRTCRSLDPASRGGLSAGFFLHRRLSWAIMLDLRVNSFRQWGHVAEFIVDVERSQVQCRINKRRGSHPYKPPAPPTDVWPQSGVLSSA